MGTGSESPSLQGDHRLVSKIAYIHKPWHSPPRVGGGKQNHSKTRLGARFL